jgi:hypothetical protein
LDPDLDPGGKLSLDPTDPDPEHCLNDQHKNVVVKTVSNVILPVIIFIDQETLPVDKTQAKNLTRDPIFKDKRIKYIIIIFQCLIIVSFVRFMLYTNPSPHTIEVFV